MAVGRSRAGLGTALWLIIGLIVAGAHHYFTNVGTLKLLASVVLAVVLWPLVLVGIDLHIH
jgi:hypothetical protein